MAVTTSHDDGFREIQLSGKQLVFLFMAVTVVLVVTFLTGVLVGRGVHAERTESAQGEAVTEVPPTPSRDPGSPANSADVDPRTVPPPAPADEDGGSDIKPGRPKDAGDEPAVVAHRPGAPDTGVATPQKGQEPVVKNAPIAVDSPKSPAPTPGTPAAPPKTISVPPTATAAAGTATAAGAAVPTGTITGDPAVKNGYAVQVEAVKVRGEADAIVKRLSGKGYAAYVEVPKGSTSLFRVRVGGFKTRREAQVAADRLKKEEKFKPWVTR